MAATIPNRSVGVIAAPYRENLLAKEDSLVVGGTAPAQGEFLFFAVITFKICKYN